MTGEEGEREELRAEPPLWPLVPGSCPSPFPPSPEQGPVELLPAQDQLPPPRQPQETARSSERSDEHRGWRAEAKRKGGWVAGGNSHLRVPLLSFQEQEDYLLVYTLVPQLSALVAYSVHPAPNLSRLVGPGP